MATKPPYKVDGRKRPDWKPQLNSADGLTHGRMSRDAKEAFWLSLIRLGGPAYFEYIGKHYPELYMDFAAKVIVKDDGSNVGGLTITVQQVTMAAVPTPGVLSSVVPGYVSPQLKLVESTDG